MLVPMAKVELIGPKSKFFDVLSLLHEVGTLHIEDLSKKIDGGEVPLEHMDLAEGQQAEKDRLDDLLIRSRSIIKALHLPSVTEDEVAHQKHYLELWQMDSRELAGEVTAVIDQVEDRTSSLAQAQTAMEAEIALLNRYEPILQKIQPLAKQIVTTGSYDSVALLVERRYKGALDALKKEIDGLTNSQCEIVSTDVDEDTTAVIVVFARKYSDAVHKFMAMENVNQIRLPSDFQDMPFDVAYDQLKVRRQELPAQLDQVRGELESLSKQWYVKLSTIRDVLVDKIDEISAIPKFGKTGYAFVVTGWLPVDDVKQLRRTIYQNFGDDVIVSQLELDEKEFEETPVALKNPKFAAPMQSLYPTLMGGMPQYGSVDPTVVLALFYPLIFGLIVGDIAYGTVYLALTLWLRAKFKDKPFIQTATAIFGPAATMTIIVGLFYGEFFGNTFYELGWIRPIHSIFGVPLPFELPFERTSTSLIMALIAISITVGVVQISYGLILGIVNAARSKHRKHAYLKGSLLLMVLGMILVVLAAVPALEAGKPLLQIASAVGLIGGFFAAMWFGKIMGFVEIIELVSHIASYIRIMAVGLAGAIFADAVNELFAKLSEGGSVGGFIAGAFLGILLHGMNMMLSAFSPNIHALRLNFLEFFGKFFEAGKEEYKPFHKTGGEKGA